MYYPKYTLRTGAIGALLDTYSKVIDELKETLASVDDEMLVKIIDHQTEDKDCQSIQTIMAHVVNSAYGYAIYIQRNIKEEATNSTRNLRPNAQQYAKDLDAAFQYTEKVLQTVALKGVPIETTDPAAKITTSWSQTFDIDQLMEHAVMHIMRHHRQIEKFISMYQKA